MEAKNISKSRNESSWKTVLQHIHGNVSCVRYGNLLAGTIHVHVWTAHCRSQKVFKHVSVAFSVTVSASCCLFSRCEIQWWWKMLHCTTLLPWRNEKHTHTLQDFLNTNTKCCAHSKLLRDENSHQTSFIYVWICAVKFYELNTSYIHLQWSFFHLTLVCQP